MTNYRLRNAITAANLTRANLAAAVDVDPKSVERWITQDRIPHPDTRARTAEVLQHDETYLWPALLQGQRAASAARAELVQLWPSRDAVPGDVWRTLIDRSQEQIDVLVYSGGFIVETFGIDHALQRVSQIGGRSRVLLGDSSSQAVEDRGVAEGMPTLPARAASTLDYLGPSIDLPGVEVRVHSTPLYVSLYRFDGELLVNPHTHGIPARESPVFHYQSVPGASLFGYYAAAFDRVWEGARKPGDSVKAWRPDGSTGSTTPMPPTSTA